MKNNFKSNKSWYRIKTIYKIKHGSHLGTAYIKFVITYNS